MALDYVSGPADGISTGNALVRWDGTTGRLVKNSGTTLSDAGAMSFPVGGSVELFNVTGANSESTLLSWVANEFVINCNKAGSGTARALRIKTAGTEIQFSPSANLISFATGAGSPTIRATGSGQSITYSGAISTTAGPSVIFGNLTSFTGSNVVQVHTQVSATFNQSSTAGYKAFQVSVTETATGSGQKDLASFEVGGNQRNRIGQNGNVYASMQTAIPAGGAANTGYFFSSTAGFGVYYGSGAPTVSAAKGSLYLRSDGSGTTDRAYINTDGGTTWTAITTVT